MKSFGHQRYMAQIDFGGLPFKKVMENIEMIGTTILPAGQKIYKGAIIDESGNLIKRNYW